MKIRLGKLLATLSTLTQSLPVIVAAVKPVIRAIKGKRDPDDQADHQTNIVTKSEDAAS